MYLTGTAHTMEPATGDRIMRGRSRLAGCYVQQKTEGRVTGYTWVPVL
jgi:hypothetical protein